MFSGSFVSLAHTTGMSPSVVDVSECIDGPVNRSSSLLWTHFTRLQSFNMLINKRKLK